MDHSKQALEMHFTRLHLPLEAGNWLLLVWDLFQSFDDVYDEPTKLTMHDREQLVWQALISYPTHPFYMQHCAFLAPLMSNTILKWVAANKAESTGGADHRSFMWRAGYYDIILAVCSLVLSPAEAMGSADYVMRMYGEKYEDYKEEFKNA